MRFARVHIFALLLSSLVVFPAVGQESTPGVASVDPINSSMSLSSDGGTYMYFNKWAGDGVGVLNSYQQFGFRANLLDLDSYGSHIFSETHLYISDQSRLGYNLGGGVRWEYDTGFFGLNGFLDQTETVNGNTYRQATIGAEYLHDGLDLLANGYFGLSDTTSHLVGVTDPNGPAFFEGMGLFTVGTGLVEKAYDGFDAEAGIPFPGLEPIRMYAGTYFLEADGDETWGARGRIQARVGQGTILNFIVSDDSTWGTNLNFQAQFMFWGESPIRTPYDYSAFSRRFDPVRRSNVVQTQVAETDVNVPVINPTTMLPYTVYHVDNTVAAGGMGSFEDRDSMLPAMTPKDLVLVYAGVGDTLGNITMIDNQQLLGEGKPHFIDTVDQGVIQLPDTFSDTGMFPTLRAANPAMNIVTLASNNRVSGFNMVGSTAADIGGANIDNFWIECIHGSSTNGVNIANASGMGVIRDSTFDANGAGTGVFVSSTGMGALNLDIDDVDTTGGARGFDIVANGSDINLTADNITGDMHSNAGFRIAADGSALTAVVNNADMTNSGRGFVQDVANGGTINSDFNNILATGTGNLFEGNVVGGGTLNTDVIGGTFSGSTTGNGIAFDLMGGMGQATFVNITANGNAIDGFNGVADGASNYNISIVDSTLIMNIDDSIDITSIGTSYVNVFYDPSNSSMNGDNGFEFLVDGGSELEAEFIDVDLSDNFNNAVAGVTMGGSTTTLDFTRVDMDDSTTGNGLALIVDGGSTLTGTFLDSSLQRSGNDNVGIMVTNDSDATLTLTNTPADSSGRNGLLFLVDDGAMGPSDLVVNVNNGTFDDNPMANILGMVLDGSTADFNFNNVTADNMAALGGMNVMVTNGGSFNSNWIGGSISNTMFNGVTGTAMGAGAGTTIDMTFDGVTIDGNDMSGIDLASTGPSAVVNLGLDNSPVTNNGLHGVTADLFDTTGTFTATNSPFTNNGTAGVGSGFRMFADGASMMTASFTGSDANMNEEHGYHFDIGLDSVIDANFAGNTATATMNGQNGLLFNVHDGGFFGLDLTAGDFSNNGLAGDASGVRGIVEGMGAAASMADVSFTGTLANNNTRDGFEFVVSNGAFFAGELNSTFGSMLSASNNMVSGVSFEATGAGTIAGLLMSGDNQFNQNGLLTGADGIDADANGVDVFVVEVSGDVNNNGGDGADIVMVNVGMGAINATGNGTGTVNENMGHGFNIDLTDTDLMNIVFNGQAVPAFNISDFAGINDNGLNGINVVADNSDAGPASIDDLTTTGNTSGIVVDLSNGSDWNLGITDSIASMNDVYGIHVAADGGMHTTNILGNTASSNGDTNILVEYSGTAVAEMHVDGNMVDGGMGTTVNEGIRVALSDTASLTTPSSVDANVTMDNGGHNIAVFMADMTSVGDLTIDGNMSTGAGLNGVHFESTSTGTVDSLSISDSMNISDNLGGGVVVSATNTTMTATTLSNNIIADNLGGDGVLIFGQDAMFGDITISDSGIVRNAGDGIDLDLNNSPVTSLNILNNNTGGAGGAVGLDFSIIGNTFAQPWVITNTSQPGNDIVGFMLDFTPTIALVPPGVEWDTIEPGSSVPFLPLLGSDVLTGLSMINGTAVVGPIVPGPGATDTTDAVATVLPGGGVPDMQGLLDLAFTDFNPGETFTWEADVDDVGAGASTVLGSDLVGTDITVNFTGGLFISGSLVPLGFNGSTFVATSGAIGSPGISSNGGNGIRLSAVNGSHIGAIDIADNGIFENGVHGIDFIIDASDLPGAGAPATISGNQISDHVNGNGFNMVDPDTVSNDIGINFTDNDITGNIVGTNIELVDADILTSEFTGNNVSMNTSFGSRFNGEDMSGFNVTIGDVAENANTYDANVDAGIVFELTDNTTSNILVENTSITGTIDGTNVNYNGDGLAVHTAMNATVDTLYVGAVMMGDNTTQFTGNEGDGFEIMSIESSIFNDTYVSNLITSMNDGNGIRLERRDTSTLSGTFSALFEDVTSSGNGLDGFDLLSTNAQLPVQNIEFLRGTYNNNEGNGWDFLAQADSVVVVNAVDSIIMGNDLHGIDVTTTERATFGNVIPSVGNPASVAAEQSIFSSLDVSENGGNGFNLVANNNSIQSILIDDAGANGRTTINSNAGNGIQITGNITTPNLLGFNDIFVDIEAVDITNSLGIMTGDGIDIDGNNNSTMRVDIADALIGATIPSNLFPGMTGNGIDADISGGTQLELNIGTNTMDIDVPDVRIYNNGGDGVQITNAGPNNTQQDNRQGLVVNMNSVHSQFNDDQGLEILLTGNIGGRTAQSDNDSPVEINVDYSRFDDNQQEGIFYQTNTGVYVNSQVQLSNNVDPLLMPTPITDLLPAYDPEFNTNGVGRNGGVFTDGFDTSTRAGDFNETHYDGGIAQWNNLYADMVVTFNVTNSTIMNNGVGGAGNEHGFVMEMSTNSYTLANVSDNTFGGNALDDFHTESFITTNAMGTALTPGASVNNTGAATFDIVTLDDTAQLDLDFQSNSGDQINVTSLGAFFTNNDPGKQNGANGNGGAGTSGGAASTRETSATNRRADWFVINNSTTVNGSNTFVQFAVPQDEASGPLGFIGPFGVNGYIGRPFDGHGSGTFPPTP